MQVNKLVKTLVSCVVCNTLMWYDYALFGALVEVISNTFFPKDASHSLRLFAAFGAFASGFFMRPIGASFFGHIGDKFGRKKALFFSMVLMMLPIGMICFTPGYDTIGIAAPILLIFMRIVQGLSLGGEAGNAAYLVEHSMENEKSTFFGSFEVVSAVLGSIIASIVIGSLKHGLGVPVFNAWGWRIAFGLGFVMSIMSLFLRHRSDESPTYQEAKDKDTLAERPVSELFKNYKQNILIAIGIDAVENSAFYIFLVFFAVFTEQIVGANGLSSYAVILTSSFLAMMTLFFAFISDIIGPKKVLMMGSIVFILLSVPIFMLLEHGGQSLTLFGYMLFVIPFAAALGPVNSVMSDLFPTEVRYTGFSLARNISGAVFGGMAPIICMLFVEVTGVKSMAGLFMSIVGLIGVISLIAGNKLEKKLMRERERDAAS